jgi:hypothetical protein
MLIAWQLHCKCRAQPSLNVTRLHHTKSAEIYQICSGVSTRRYQHIISRDLTPLCGEERYFTDARMTLLGMNVLCWKRDAPGSSRDDSLLPRILGHLSITDFLEVLSSV